MSSIWSGSIHSEINDFDVISICQYAQSICEGPYTFAKCTFFLAYLCHVMYSEWSLKHFSRLYVGLGVVVVWQAYPQAVFVSIRVAPLTLYTCLTKIAIVRLHSARHTFYIQHTISMTDFDVIYIARIHARRGLHFVTIQCLQMTHTHTLIILQTTTVINITHFFTFLMFYGFMVV